MSIASSRLPIRSVVVAETWLAAALFAYVLGPGMWSIVGAIIGVVAAGTTLIRGLRGTRSGSVTLPRRRLFGRAAGPASPEFPLPVDVTVDDGRVGVRCAGTTLISVVRVAEIQPVPVAVTTHPPPVASLPLAVLADCLEQFDIRLDGIDVVHVAGRDWSTDRVGLTCGRTLGPLAVTTHRTVYLVLRLDPLRCPDAVARRGSGRTGAMRTASIATRRVAARLAEHSVSATVLTAAEIVAVDAALALCRSGAGAQTYIVDPGDGSAASVGQTLENLWTASGPSITTTLRLRPDHPTTESPCPAITALVRFPTAPHGLTPPPGLLVAPDASVDVLAAGLAVSSSTRIARQLPALRGAAAADLLRHTRIPVAAHGQLLGADDVGRAVAYPVVAPGGPRVIDVLAGPALMIQIAVRAVAAGAAVTVHTARPAIWEPLMRAVGDPRRLSPAPGHPPPPHAVPVHLYDDVPAPAEPHPGITTIRVTVADRASQDVTVAPDPPVIARIVQDADRDSMLLTTAAGSQRLTLVATPDEWQLIGRSVPASAELSRPRS